MRRGWLCMTRVVSVHALPLYFSQTFAWFGALAAPLGLILPPCPKAHKMVEAMNEVTAPVGMTYGQQLMQEGCSCWRMATGRSSPGADQSPQRAGYLVAGA